MNYLKDDSGNEIVLGQQVAVTINKQVVSFLNFSIKGNFSTNFDIPNTALNRKSLGYYGLNQTDKPAFSNQPWGLYKDGNQIDRGLIVIQNEDEEALDCFFASGNAPWLNILTGNLKDMNWSDYDQDMTAANVISRSSATSGVVFPLVDWGYNFQKANACFNAFAMRDTTNDPHNFIYDFYPAMYLKTIVKEIAKQQQFKITGNIFEDPTFDKTIIPLPGIDRSLGDPVYMTDQDQYDNQLILAGATATMTFQYQSSEMLMDLTNGRIQNDDRSRNVRVKIYFGFLSNHTGNVFLRRNGVTEYTFTFAVDNVTRYQTLTLAPGDYLDVQIQNTSAVTMTVDAKYFGYELCGSWYESGLDILAVDVVPNIPILEIIRYISQAFNCLVSFNDFTQTISFKKIDSTLKENALDITENVISTKKSWQNGFGRTNYIRTNQTADLQAYNNGVLKFGEFAFSGPANGKGQVDVLELKFGPSVVKPQQKPSMNWRMSYIPLFKLEDDGEPIPYSSVTGATALFNLSITLDQALPSATIVRVVDDNGIYDGYYVVSTVTTTTNLSLFGQYQTGNSTGTIRRQKISFPISAGFRVLVNYPECLLSKIGVAIALKSTDVANQIRIGTTIASVSNQTAWNMAYYYIPESPYAFSSELRLGLNPGPITGAVSVPLSISHYRRLQRIANNAKLSASLRFSEQRFNELDLSELFFVGNEDYSGYFFISKIQNYKDSITECPGELLKID